MKKNLLRMMAMAMAVVVFVACRDDETDLKSKAMFSFDVASLIIDSAPHSFKTVEVTTNSDDFVVIIPDDASWLTSVKDGNTVRFISVLENPSFDASRSTTVRFRGAGLNTSGGTASFVVRQRAALHEVVFTLDPELVELLRDAGSSGDVAVTTAPESEFTVTIPEDAEEWLEYSVDGIVVTFTALTTNDGDADRTASVTLTAQGSKVKNSTKTLTVTQTFKTTPTFSFDPETIELANDADDTKPVTVTTNSSDFSVTIDPADTWLGYDRESGSNVVTFKALSDNIDPNNGRTATVTFTATGDNTYNGSETYTVTQKVGDPLPPFTFTFVPATSVNIGNTMGATAEVAVTTNSNAYSATTTADWLSIDQGGLTGGTATVTFTVTGLNLDLDNTRTAEITFTGTGTNTDNTPAAVTYSVIQAVGVPTLLITEADRTVWIDGFAGANAEVPVVTNVTTLTLTPAGIDGLGATFDAATGKITITGATANPAATLEGGAKTGTITVAIAGEPGAGSITLNVTQDVNFAYVGKKFAKDGTKGVVFWVDPADNKKAKIVSLNRVVPGSATAGLLPVGHDYEYSIGGAAAAKLSNIEITGADHDDGEQNVVDIKAFATTNSIPIAEFNFVYQCDTMQHFGSGFYLPSNAELKQLFEGYWGVEFNSATVPTAAASPRSAWRDNWGSEPSARADAFDAAMASMGGSTISSNFTSANLVQFCSSNQPHTGSGISNPHQRFRGIYFDMQTAATFSISKVSTARGSNCIKKVSY